MNDPSHKSSSSYKVDKQKYDDNWDRIFGKKENKSYETDTSGEGVPNNEEHTAVH